MEELVPITPFSFTKPLRNIRVHLDDTELILDLIPEMISSEVFTPPEGTSAPVISIQVGAREILEADSMLRLMLERIASVAISDEFCDVHPVELETPLEHWPRIGDTKAVYPVLEVRNSKWHTGLPDYQGGGSDGGMTHYRIVSLTTQIDVNGCEPTGEWMNNPTR